MSIAQRAWCMAEKENRRSKDEKKFGVWEDLADEGYVLARVIRFLYWLLGMRLYEEWWSKRTVGMLT